MRTSIGIRLCTTSTYNLGKYLGLPPIIGRGKKEAFLENKAENCPQITGMEKKAII